MTVTIKSFLAVHREFATAGEELVNATLELAEASVSADVYGDSYDKALALTAAHLLWTSPFGAAMRLDGGGDQKQSRYISALAALRRQRSPRIIVL